ncbi:MAG: hypothetical protein ING73_17170 [Rhodocyclaceae bacterium]|nr:hypothetical protein [Rhodocyclaceae bacterium]
MSQGLLGRLGVELYADMSRFAGDLGKATKEVDGFVDKATSGFTKTQGAILGLAGSLGVLSFVNKVNEVAKLRGALDDLADSGLGTVETLSQLQRYSKMSGVSFDETTGALSKMSRGLAGTEKETSKAGDALKRLGIETRDSTGQLRAPADVFKDMADRLSKYADNADKATFAQSILGKGGEKYLPLLKDMVEFGEINATVTAEQAAWADTYGKSLTRLEIASQGVANVVAGAMIPVFSGFVEALTETVKGADGAKGSVRSLANDGTLTEWGRMAAFAVGSVIDILQYLARYVTLAAENIGTFLAMAVDGIGSISGAIASVFSGDFKKADDILKNFAKRGKATFVDVADKAKQIFTAPTFTDKLSDAFTNQSMKIAAASKDSRASLDSTGLGATETAEKIDKLTQSFGKLADDIKKATSQSEFQISALQATGREAKSTKEATIAYALAYGELQNLDPDKAAQLLAWAKTADKTKEAEEYLKNYFKLVDKENAEDVKEWTESQQKKLDTLIDTLDKFEVETKAANVSMIKDDKARALAQLEIESEKWRKIIDQYAEGSLDRQQLETAFTNWRQSQVDKLNFEASNKAAEEWFQLLEGGFKASLEGAKSFGDYIKTGLKKALYDLIAKPFLVNISAILGSAGGTGSITNLLTGGGSGGFNITSLLSSLGSGLATGLGNLALGGANIASGLGFSGIGSALSNFGGAATGLTSGAGSMAGGLGSSLAAASPYITAAMAAYAIWNATRDKGENPKYQLGFGSAARAYETNSAFGLQGFNYAQGNNAQNMDFVRAQQSTAGIDTLLTRSMTAAQIAAATSRLSGVTSREFSFPKGDATAGEQLLLEFTKIKYAAVFADLDKTFSDYVAGFTGKSEDLIKEIGIMGAVLDGLSTTTIKGLTITSLRAFQAEGENLANTFARVAKGFGEYESLFIPEAERNQKAFDALRDTLTEQNVVLPRTREGYRRLVEGLDLSDEKQRKLWQTLIDAAGVADLYYKTVGEGSDITKLAAGQIADSVNEITDASGNLTEAARTLADASVQAMSAALDAINAIQSFRSSNNAIIANTLRGRAGYDYGAYLQSNVNAARAGLIGATSINDRLAAAGNLRDTLGAQYDFRLQEMRQAQAAQSAAMSAQIASMRTLADQAKALAETFRSIGQYGRALLLSEYSTLSPEAKLRAANGDFQSLLSRARGGDASAAGRLEGAAGTYLQQARDFYGSSPAFAAIFDSTQQALVGFESAADQQSQIAASMLAQTEAMQSNIDSLANSLTPEMIKLQDDYIKELQILNASSLAWEKEQRDIADRNAATYISIEATSKETAENTAALRADIRALLDLQRTATTAVTHTAEVIGGELPTFGNALGMVRKNTAVTAAASVEMSKDSALTRAGAIVNG